jgi:hypothetical protein
MRSFYTYLENMGKNLNNLLVFNCKIGRDGVKENRPKRFDFFSDY